MTSWQSLRRRSSIFLLLFGGFLLTTRAADASPQVMEAYFYEFKPSSCQISLTGYSSGGCEEGAITVSTQDINSVNIHLFGKLGHWQLVLSSGNSLTPKVEYAIIRSATSLSDKKPIPDFLYSKENGDIVDGSCTPIPITSSTSGRCIVQLRNGNNIDIRFKTNSLKQMQDVQKRL